MPPFLRSMCSLNRRTKRLKLTQGGHLDWRHERSRSERLELRREFYKIKRVDPCSSRLNLIEPPAVHESAAAQKP